ncbi:MAG: ATP-binding cassette domain-containing protein [Methylococcus sp.]
MDEKKNMSAVPVQQPSHPKPEESPVLLRAQGLSKAFGGQVVLDNVGLELRQGEVVLLRGENGSGKTTLLNILTGNLQPDAGEIHYLADGSPRSYRFPRRWWQELNPFDHFTPEFVAREGIGRTWQDVRLFGSQTLRENLAVATPGHPRENPLLALFAPHRAAGREAEINQIADAMLARLGLAGREDSSADKISLGQSKRVAIARAVLAGAKILFLDEPLAGLDRQGIEDVLGLLKSLVVEQGITLIIVEHLFNQPHLQGLVTSNWLLEAGKLQRSGKSCLSSTQRSTNQNKSPHPSWISLFDCEANAVFDEPLPRGAFLTRIRRRETIQTNHTALLDIQNIVVSRGSHTVIGLNNDGDAVGFCLSLVDGEIAILHAPNGWGKSTLAEVIMGRLKPITGDIFVDGRSISKLSVWDRCKAGLSLVSATKNVVDGITVSEQFNLASVASMPECIKSLRNRNISTLSGGQKQLVAVFGATGKPEPKIRIYDEPFAMLDAQSIIETVHSISSNNEMATLILVPTSLSI